MNKWISIFLIIFSFSSFEINGNKKALIIGITGQDGIYLSDLLNDKGYEIYGISRSKKENFERANSPLKKIKFEHELIYYSLDVNDTLQLKDLIKSLKPDEIYYLAAQSSVAYSFEHPENSFKSNVLGPLAILEVVRQINDEKQIRLFFASSSEIIQKNIDKLKEDEDFNLGSSSPYGCSKLALYNLCKIYRETYGLYICSAILFNHESPIRPEKFLMRKISKSVAEIYLNKRQVISIGNLNSQRDYGYAKDYVKAMWLMLQGSKPNDYIIANGNLLSVRQIIELSFKCIDRNIIWEGTGLEEKGYDKKTGELLVQVDPAFYRPAESLAICGNSQKAKIELNWNSTLTVNELIKLMVQHDIEILKNI